MNPPHSIPPNYVQNSKGEWCHPSRVQNAPQTHAKAPPSDSVVVADTKTPKRIRQSSKPLLNKLESEWSLVLFERYGQFGFPIFPQSIRFKLANGVWYKPDFVVFCEQGIMAFECKGPYAFRGGFENLKVAAHQYPNRIHWTLVWKEDGQWKEQAVFP